MVFDIYAYRNNDTGEIFNPCLIPDVYTEKSVVVALTDKLSQVVNGEKKLDDQMISLLNTTKIVKLGSLDSAIGLVPLEKIKDLTSPILYDDLLKKETDTNE